MKFYLILILLLASRVLVAQEEVIPSRVGWHWGASIGVYFPNKYTANYYNGTRVEDNGYGVNPDSTNIARVIFNPLIEKQIREELQGYGYEMGEYPQNMKYSKATSLVAHARYNFSELLAVFLQFGYQKLTASDVFTLNVDRYNSGFTTPYYETCNILGKEQRTNIDFGLIRYFPSKKNPRITPYTSLGANINDVKVLSQQIQIGKLVYDITNPYNKIYNVDEGGIGYGANVGGGVNFLFSEKFSFDLGMNLYFMQIHLAGYEAYRPNIDVHLRLLF